MLKASDVATLTESIIELSSRTLLIGKMMKEKSEISISSAEFDKMKTKLVEAYEKIKSLTLQVEEMNVLNAQRESEKENLKSKITELNFERLKRVMKKESSFKLIIIN